MILENNISRELVIELGHDARADLLKSLAKAGFSVDPEQDDYVTPTKIRDRKAESEKDNKINKEHSSRSEYVRKSSVKSTSVSSMSESVTDDNFSDPRDPAVNIDTVPDPKLAPDPEHGSVSVKTSSKLSKIGSNIYRTLRNRLKIRKPERLNY